MFTSSKTLPGTKFAYALLISVLGYCILDCLFHGPPALLMTEAT